MESDSTEESQFVRQPSGRHPLVGRVRQRRLVRGSKSPGSSRTVGRSAFLPASGGKAKSGKEILVIKFGGTSVDGTERIKAAAQIALREQRAGSDVVVVVSAMGHSTDQLLALADEVTPNPALREIDLLLATGEQVSAALFALAVQAQGGRCQALNGAQAGIVTDGKFGNAEILEIRPEAIKMLLSRNSIVVVTGFQGATESGEITTLGRGGSDTTAIALSAYLKAYRCDIYTDVDGVYNADPRKNAAALRYSTIDYQTMLYLARNGAQVLNARSVEIALQFKVKVRVRSTFAPEDEGTLLVERDVETPREKLFPEMFIQSH